jgi:ParB/RepB/Spo0J family partition protein
MTTTAPSPLFRFTNTAEEEIPANQLHRYPANRIPTAAAIAAMRDSIKENGQLQPVTVRPLEDGAGGEKLEIIFGETRVLGAAAIRPDHPVRAYIIPMSDQEAARIHAVENFTRQQLDPIEEAEAMENEGLVHVRDHPRLMDHEAGDGVGLVIRQRPVEGAVEVADRHSAVDEV